MVHFMDALTTLNVNLLRRHSMGTLQQYDINALYKVLKKHCQSRINFVQKGMWIFFLD